MAKLTKYDYQIAIEIQNAVNLSGVLHTWMDIIPKIRETVDSTAELNQHPISVLFAYKVASLSGQDHPNEVLDRAWAICKDLGQNLEET